MTHGNRTLDGIVGSGAAWGFSVLGSVATIPGGIMNTMTTIAALIVSILTAYKLLAPFRDRLGEAPPAIARSGKIHISALAMIVMATVTASACVWSFDSWIAASKSHADMLAVQAKSEHDHESTLRFLKWTLDRAKSVKTLTNQEAIALLDAMQGYVQQIDVSDIQVMIQFNETLTERLNSHGRNPQ